MGVLDGALRRQVADLIMLVQNSDLTEIDIEHGTFAVHIERDGGVVPPAQAPLSAPGPDGDVDLVVEPNALRSPQVGTFYLSAEPKGEPFVHEGSVVEPGQVIGLIEAMKLIVEVEAEAGGVIRRVLVEDGQPVEYGQPLFELE
jgi:acetyl-CoA carboxylase biotin carboxyl carrier protein